ncbi:MAG: hypothetical protein H6557_27110 [Lewinellaceae bacterium]|nr:hypothetical protein [Phaeodactylibacter sp.]MCB9040312.1 hypothetical protein [Lewinellaceae bacterium]
MKTSKYLVVFFLTGTFAFLNSCVEDKNPFPDFQDAVNMRIVVDPDFSTINKEDPASAKVVLDFYSENIEDVEKVDLHVDFFDFSEGSTSDRSFLRTIEPGSFQDGVLRGVEITFDDLKNALGLQAEDFDGLDQVTIYNTTTLKDGRVYPSVIEVNNEVSINNVTPNIQNSSATTSFTTQIVVFVQCPLTEGFATGKYLLEQVSGPSDPFFGNDYRWTPEEVTLTSAGPIQRTFSGKYLTFDQDFTFVVTCGILVVNRTDTGLSCGGPSFVFEQDGINEYEDDKEFTITLTDNVDGACGQPVGEPLVLKLTKI